MRIWICCFLLWAIIIASIGSVAIVGCATPATHDEWATRCFNEPDQKKFDECVLEWDAWAERQLRRS